MKAGYPEVITEDMLWKKGGDAFKLRAKFLWLFPKGMVVTRENLLNAQKEFDTDLIWAACILLQTADLEKFNGAITSAKRAYFLASTSAWQVQKKALDSAVNHFTQEANARRVYRDTIVAADHIFDEAVANALADILELP